MAVYALIVWGSPPGFSAQFLLLLAERGTAGPQLHIICIYYLPSPPSSASATNLLGVTFTPLLLVKML